MVAIRLTPIRLRLGGCLLLLACGIGLAGRSVLAADGPTDPVRAALGRDSFPWYDAPADKIKTVKLPPQPDLNAGRGLRAPAWRVVDFLVLGVFVMALIGLIVAPATGERPRRTDQEPAGGNGSARAAAAA